MADDWTQALLPVAEAAFEAAAKRLTDLSHADADLENEARQIQAPTGLPDEADHDTVVCFSQAQSAHDRWRMARLMEIQIARARNAARMASARAEASKAFGRCQALRELAVTPPDGRYR